LASCLARSFLLENPPPDACEQAGYRQKNDFVCRLWCLRRSQPLVKEARDVHPGYAHDHEPSALTKPYRLRSACPGDEGVRQCPWPAPADVGEADDAVPAEPRGDCAGLGSPVVMMVVFVSGPCRKGFSVWSARLMGEARASCMSYDW
jgi:hypothetical protein